MQNIQTIIQEAISSNACELILESGKQVRFVKQNDALSLNKFGVIEKDWIKNVVKTLLGDEFSKFAPGHPQKISYTMKDVGEIRVVARDNIEVSVRFFFPPNGEQLCNQYWDTIGDESSDESGFNKLPKFEEAPAQQSDTSPNTDEIKIEEIKIEEVKPEESKTEESVSLEITAPSTEQTTEQTEVKLDSPELELETVPEEAALSLETDIKTEDVKPPVSTTTPIQDIPFDINSALAFENMEPAPAAAPPPPSSLPPPVVNPDVDKVPDSDLILNAVGVPDALDQAFSTPNADAPPPSETPVFNLESTGPEVGLELEKADEVDLSLATDTAMQEAPSLELETIKEEPQVIPVSQTVQSTSGIHEILAKMQSLNASHLHLQTGSAPSFRVGKELKQESKNPLNEASLQALLRPILPGPKGWENFREVSFLHMEGNKSYRVHIFKDLNGSSAVFKSLSSEIRSLKDWNLPQRVNELCEFKQGLVIVSASNETLISSFLSSLTHYLGDFLQGRIISLEHEILHMQNPKNALVSQREIGLHTRSFSEGLRSALQENPDLLMVSQLTGRKSADLVLKSSRSTLVFAGLKAQTLEEARTALDALLGSGAKAKVETLLRDIVFLSEDKGAVQASFGGQHPAASKAS